MNFETLSLVVEELGELLTNARVERVYQGRGGGVYLLLQRGREKYILLLSPDRTMPRLHLVGAKPAVEDPPHGFILFLRSHVSGARVTGINLPEQDRVVEIRFSRQGTEYRLLFELFGSSANLVLVDSSSTVLAVYYAVPPAEGAARPLLPGLRYLAPEKPRTTGQRARELSPEFSVGASPSREAERYYEHLLEQRHIGSLRSSLSSLLKKRLAKAGRLMKALTGDTRSTEQIEENRRQGDLILANLKNLKTGMERAELPGYDGAVVEVLLDPKRSPARNAEHYFKKYKKAKAGREIIAKRLQQAAEEASYLEALLSRIDRTDDVDELIDLRNDLEAKGYGGQKKTAMRKTRQGTAAPAVRKIMFNGWELLVGRSAKGNDQLTTKIARPDDLWLHAEGMPGSHVLVRNPNAGEVPPDVLAKAAALAAFYSKGKHAGKVPVTYSRAGLVKKPKGAKPGLVTLKERKTLMVKPEDA